MRLAKKRQPRNKMRGKTTQTICKLYNYKRQKMEYSNYNYESAIEKNCTMVIIPRKDFNRQINVDLLGFPCFYILLDQLKDKAQCYVGYTNNPIERITTHNSKSRGKTFWNYALVFLYYDTDNNCHFDITDTAYLEYLAINSIDKYYGQNRMKSLIRNWKKADMPYIKPFAKDNITNVFEDIKTLVSRLGLHLFDDNE